MIPQIREVHRSGKLTTWTVGDGENQWVIGWRGPGPLFDLGEKLIIDVQCPTRRSARATLRGLVNQVYADPVTSGNVAGTGVNGPFTPIGAAA